MNFIYLLLSSLLSLTLIAVISIPVGRMRNSSAVFSAALGIIIFGCMRGIFVECGWEFAALFGVRNGIAVQTVLFAASVLFFRALAEENKSDVKENRISGFCSLTCFGFGKSLMRNYSELYDMRIYILGEAADFALTAMSLEYIRNESGEKFSAAAEALLILGLRTAVVIIYHSVFQVKSEFAASGLLLMGTAGFICEITRALSEKRDISAVGFAAGVTVSFCISSLEG